jgi:hypothetical protein
MCAEETIPARARFFNSPHLFSIAREAYQRIADAPARQPGQHDALVSVVFAASALEAFINEVAAMAADPMMPGVNPPVVAALATSLQEAVKNHTRTRCKYQAASMALTSHRYNEGAAPFQDFATLLSLRNNIVHSDAEEFDFIFGQGRLGEEKIITRLPRSIVACFPADTVPPGITPWFASAETPAPAGFDVVRCEAGHYYARGDKRQTRDCPLHEPANQQRRWRKKVEREKREAARRATAHLTARGGEARVTDEDKPLQFHSRQAVVMTTTGMEAAIHGDGGLLVEGPEHGEPALCGPFASRAEAEAEAQAIMDEARARGVGLTFLVADFNGNGTWAYAMATITGNHVQLFTEAEAMQNIKRAKGR